MKKKTTKKLAAKKKLPVKKTPARKKLAAKKTPAKKKTARRRADFGAPVDGFFAKQPAALKPIVLALRALIKEIAPTASATLKWGMPFYSLYGAPLCAIGAHKGHVNLILSGPHGTFADPDGRLAGAGNTGRHLKLTTIDELPREAIRGWLRTATSRAESYGKRAGLA